MAAGSLQAFHSTTCKYFELIHAITSAFFVQRVETYQPTMGKGFTKVVRKAEKQRSKFSVILIKVGNTHFKKCLSFLSFIFLFGFRRVVGTGGYFHWLYSSSN